MDFTITDRTQSMIRLPTFKGGTETINIDYAPWSDDHGNLSTVVITVKSGTATIANEALSGNTKTFTLATSQTGPIVLELKATAGNNIHISNLYTLTKDYTTHIEDYGLCS